MKNAIETDLSVLSPNLYGSICQEIMMECIVSLTHF